MNFGTFADKTVEKYEKNTTLSNSWYLSLKSLLQFPRALAQVAKRLKFWAGHHKNGERNYKKLRIGLALPVSWAECFLRSAKILAIFAEFRAKF